MNRNLPYGLVFFVVFAWLILPRIIDPQKGLVYIAEESFALFMLIFGVAVFRKPVKKFIKVLNDRFPWKTATKRRLGIQLSVVVAGALFITGTISAPVVFYVEHNGVPDFYINILDKKSDKHNEHHPNSETPRDFRQEIKISNFIQAILQGSAFCLLILIIVEEAFDTQQRRAQKNLDQEVILKEQAQLRAMVLQRQLDPHFMFNTLNVLSGLIYKDVDKSAQFIKDLSKVYRYVLEQSEELVSTIDQEFKFLESYIFLLKIRFDDKLPISINIPEDRKDWLIPSMTLELLVENAIKHNVVDRESPLHLDFAVKENQLVVKNNLQPRNSHETSLGFGLKNLEKRLELLELSHYSFSVEGNEYVAVIPLINPEDV